MFTVHYNKTILERRNLFGKLKIEQNIKSKTWKHQSIRKFNLPIVCTKEGHSHPIELGTDYQQSAALACISQRIF